MLIRQNVSLLPYNTFGIDTCAERFLELDNIDEIREISTLHFNKKILGGGSNILLSKNIKGLVLQNQLKGISVVKENEEYVWLEVASGEIWHEFVLYAIKHNLAGIENLALIPGTVGAAPIQNIGAYGIEAKETIESVKGWHWAEKTFLNYTNGECKFGYRDSVFKQSLKENFFITSVVFRLNKKHSFKTSYGAIAQELDKMCITELSIKAIAEAVINIRTSKLPDPKKIGNAGSFFKNPTIPKNQFEGLEIQFPDLPSYPASANMVKLPAGWLIEQCGWKGFRRGDVGVHEKQALVLVNFAHAKGEEIWKLSEEIVESVKKKFDIELEREVQVW